MGFSKPKAVKAEPAPPPVTTTGTDVAFSAEAERKKQVRRNGYQKTLLSPGMAPQAPGKKTLLG